MCNNGEVAFVKPGDFRGNTYLKQFILQSLLNAVSKWRTARIVCSRKQWHMSAVLMEWPHNRNSFPEAALRVRVCVFIVAVEADMHKDDALKCFWRPIFKPHSLYAKKIFC